MANSLHMTSQIEQDTELTRYDEDTAGILELLCVDIARDVALAASRGEGCGHTWTDDVHQDMFWDTSTYDLPMIRPFPVFNSSAIFTLLPGEPSCNSTLGTLSPIWT